MSGDAGLKGPSLLPASGGPAKQLVVLLHGLGADGEDLISLAASWSQALPDAAFHAPNAPYACDMSPYGYQWFSLAARDPMSVYQGVVAARDCIDHALDFWLAHYGIDDSKLALVGFSQGCMMSLHVGLRRKRACGAIVGYSGFLVGAELLESQIVSRPPCLLVHGDADTVVSYDLLVPSEQALKKAGVPVETLTCRGLGHSIDMQGLNTGLTFLRKHLA